MTTIKHLLPIARYSLVVCRNKQNKYLCVQERTSKWWIPGGAVEAEETHEQAALRQTRQQAGIEVKLKGVLSFDQLNFGGKDNITGYRIIYYAEPVDENAVPKQISDKQSMKAEYLTLKEIIEKRSEWRIAEIYNFPKYLEDGGEIYPLSIFKQSKK